LSKGETVTLDVNLKAFIRREKARLWVAICPTLGVASQGKDKDSAMRSLHEAVELWFESCIERGVLDQAMREANWRPLAHGEAPSDEAEHVIVDRKRGDEDVDDILGEAIHLQVAIPAYQAAAFMAAR
jgi:predicted RNase H-like HicB family nuclease